MPHIAIKLYPGRSEALKQALAAAINQRVQEVLNCEERYVSISFEEVPPERWREEVYQPEILDHPERVYQKPGY